MGYNACAMRQCAPLSPRLYAVLAALTLVLAGCATAVTNAFPHVNHDTAVLEWGIVGTGDVQTLDPALVSDPTSFTVASLVYGGLVRLDARLRVVPDGADRWSISPNGKVYTFHIRHGLRFADGRPVTALDFAAALDRALGPEGTSGTASFYLNLIARHASRNGGRTRFAPAIDVLSPSKLRITLVRPAAHYLAELALPVSYVPDPRVMARYGDTWTDHAAGFGPFSVAEWRHSQYLRLVRNPYYYSGIPAVKSIVLHFATEASALAAYRSGHLDLVSGIQPGQTLPGKPFGIRRVPALAMDYLAFNTARLPFHRLNARRAFAAAWSPSFASAAMGRSAFPAAGLPPSAFLIPSTRWRPTASPRTYLHAARYANGDALPSLTLILPRDPRLLILAEDMRQAWETKLGVSIALQELNTSNYGRVLGAHAFDLALVEWGGDYPDPQDFLGTQLGSSADNITGWSGTLYNRTVSLADSYAPTDPRRRALFRQAATLALEKLPILPLSEPAQTAVIRPDLAGVALTPLGTIWGDWSQAHLRS